MDLSLPERASEMEAVDNAPMQLLPFALYLLEDLLESEVEHLLKVCNEQTDAAVGEIVRLPPRSQFIGGPLRAAFQYHISLGEEGTFDPRYFIAVTSRAWRDDGVLLVTLSDEVPDGKVDNYWVQANAAGLLVANLQIGNMDWYESKEGFALDRSFPSSEETQGHEIDGQDKGSSSKATIDTVSRGSWGAYDDGAPDRSPPAGFYIGIYLTCKKSFQDVLPLLEPAYGRQPPEDYICRFEGGIEPGPHAIHEASKLHPVRALSGGRRGTGDAD
ncbi:hypothetical protein LTR17_014473 [Elasticomyces elasticus]|nr:hypothetical protein LTR17_014473 [Elasticomyces elasticus]